MLKRLNDSFVRKQFEDYGFKLPPGWMHFNNKIWYDMIMPDGSNGRMSYQRPQQDIKRGKIKIVKPKTAFDKWRKKQINRQDPDFP